MPTRLATAAQRPGRSVFKLAATAMASAALAATLVAPAEAHPRHGGGYAQPSRIDLPDGFRPEGITINKRGTAYLGSLADGDILAVNLRTQQQRVISQGPGTPSVGLKVAGDRLYVAGGPAGSGRVVSTRTGAILATYQFTPAVPDQTFVNDVVLTKRAAYFTDSRQPQLYRVSYARNAQKAKVRTIPLTGDWVQTAGVNNANGIALSPDRRSLLVVQSNTSTLFRVDPDTGVARRVDLGGYALTNGDGLLVKGRTLYVVQNRLNQVAVFHLNHRGSRGALVKTLTSPEFDVPTTVAAYKGSLYLPNARFGNPAPATADFWITRIRP